MRNSNLSPVPVSGLTVSGNYQYAGLFGYISSEMEHGSYISTQDEIRTVVNAVLGECIRNLSYSERRMAIELELTVTLDDDVIGNLCCQFPITADYDGVGMKGSKFAFYL